MWPGTIKALPPEKSNAAPHSFSNGLVSGSHTTCWACCLLIHPLPRTEPRGIGKREIAGNQSAHLPSPSLLVCRVLSDTSVWKRALEIRVIGNAVPKQHFQREQQFSAICLSLLDRGKASLSESPQSQWGALPPCHSMINYCICRQGCQQASEHHPWHICSHVLKENSLHS